MNAILLSIKINEIVNKFLLVGDNFMPEMHLKQPDFIYSACGPFTKNKERIEKLEIEILFIQMNLIKLVFNMLWFIRRFNKKNTIR